MGETISDKAPSGTPAHQAWVSSVAGNFTARLFSLVAAVVIARVLGPEGRGTIASALLWPSIVAGASITNLASVTYFGSKRGTVGLKTNAWIGLVMATCLTPVAAGAIWFATRGQQANLSIAVWVSLLVPLVIGSSLVGGTLLSEGKVTQFWLTRVTTTFITATTTVVLALVGVLSVRLYLGVFLTATLIGLVVGFTLQTQLTRPERASRELVPEAMRYGGRTVLTQIASSLNLRLDQMFISLLLPAAVLGHYSVALSWASSVYVVTSALGTVVLSRTVQMNVIDAESRDAAATRLRRAGFAGFFVAAGVSAAAPIAIPLIFGPQYRGAIVPAVLLSLGSGAVAWKGFLHEFARATGEPSIGRLPELLGIVVRATGTALVLTSLGGIGAAAVSVVAALTIVFAFVTRLSRTIDLPTRAFVPGLADARFVVRAVLEYLRHQRTRALGFLTP